MFLVLQRPRDILLQKPAARRYVMIIRGAKPLAAVQHRGHLFYVGLGSFDVPGSKQADCGMAEQEIIEYIDSFRFSNFQALGDRRQAELHSPVIPVVQSLREL